MFFIVISPLLWYPVIGKEREHIFSILNKNERGVIMEKRTVSLLTAFCLLMIFCFPTYAVENQEMIRNSNGEIVMKDGEVVPKNVSPSEQLRELKEKGFSDEQLNRIYGPIGLDLGGREPSEIALSILSQITMIRSGGKLPSRTILEAVQREQKDKNEKNR